MRAAICVVLEPVRGDIHDPLWHVAIGKQRRNRQHRTGFLDIKQAAEMFGGAAQRQGVLIIAFDQSPLRTGIGVSCQP